MYKHDAVAILIVNKYICLCLILIPDTIFQCKAMTQKHTYPYMLMNQ